MAKFKFIIYSRYVGADIVEEIEIPDDELEELTQNEREDYLNEACTDWMRQTVEYGWKEIDEDEEEYA